MRVRQARLAQLAAAAVVREPLLSLLPLVMVWLTLSKRAATPPMLAAAVVAVLLPVLVGAAVVVLVLLRVAPTMEQQIRVAVVAVRIR